MDMQSFHMQIVQALNKLLEKVDAWQNDRVCSAGAGGKLRVTQEEITKLQQVRQQMVDEICKLMSELSITQLKIKSHEEMLDEHSCTLVTERSFWKYLPEQLKT